MKIGFIGCGGIANNKHMPALAKLSAKCEMVAFCDIIREKAEKAAQEYGTPDAAVYTDYRDLVARDDIEVIHVLTPNSSHAELSIAALEAGKHVLCEKAFMLNAREAEEVFALARERGLFVAEAIWTRYQPARRILNEIIGSGEIGAPKFLTAHLGYPILHKERVRKAELGGGALLDIGVYCLNFAVMNFGHDISEVTTSCVKNEEGVDISETIILKYSDGRMASLTTTVLSANYRQGVILCDNGSISTENINNPLSFDIYSRDQKFVRKVEAPRQESGFEYEVQECIDSIRAGLLEPPSMPHEETLFMMRLMDNLRKQWGVRFPGE